MRRRTLDEMKEMARSRGGECLSEEYGDAHSKLIWRCAKGHEWQALFQPIEKRGVWCPFCSQRVRLTIEEMKELARSKGGECLSEEYGGAHSKLIWRCAKGHEWAGTPAHIRFGKWCPACYRQDRAGSSQRLDAQEIRFFAKKRGGECLSNEYTNNKTKMLWKCSKGHEWSATFDNIRAGRWCPECAAGKSERLVRLILKEDFGISTKKARPSFLRHLKGKPLELDGFQSDLRLAWEHQGIQHRQFDPFFHRGGEKDFETQKERDAFKREATALQGILLFEIPQTEKPTRESIKATIEREALRLCLPFAFNPQFQKMMAHSGL